MTTVAMRPDDSSSSRFTVTPGIMSLKTSVPPFSERTGMLYGSQTARTGALGDLLAVADVKEGADNDVVALELLALVVDDLDRAGLVEDDVAALGRLHEAERRGT